MTKAGLKAYDMIDIDMKWQPSHELLAESNMARFRDAVAAETGALLPDYASLWQWSIDFPAQFWARIWDTCGVIGDKGDAPYLLHRESMMDAVFFPQARLNYGENLLRRRDDTPAIIMKGEHGLERTMTTRQLYDLVSRIRQYLVAQGIVAGDRVAGYLPNIDLSLACCLAATSLGAVWSSASPDFGVQGVVDRFGQIAPKILFAAEGYSYNGKKIDCTAKIAEIAQKLPGLQATVIVPYVAPDAPTPVENSVAFEDALAPYAPADIVFERVAFNHPLFIMFSSGTTGVPKCIVHGTGGTLLQHMKEHQLHSDIRPNDRVFYFTTLGWMMWNWQITALASNATLMLFDGSPFYPDGNTLFDFAEKYRCTFFGTSAKYIDSLKTNGVHPINTHDLYTVRTIASTGSPLVHESFDFVYECISRSAQLASISGGTDIVSCFVLGNPMAPVWRGEIQGPGLGLAVDVYGDDGKPVRGEKGELVCTQPFPCMPVGFWNDESREKYKAAYFDRFENTWCHGDWCEVTDHGGFIIHGRSDATLNPGGVRIGTAEIYRQVEKLPEIRESIAVGQDWEGDVRVVLFVVMKDGAQMTDDLQKRIRTAIREGASPRHVPAKIIAVADIPRTKSGKMTELAVRDVIHGRTVKNVEALANPDALALYRDLPELATA